MNVIHRSLQAGKSLSRTEKEKLISSLNEANDLEITSLKELVQQLPQLEMNWGAELKKLNRIAIKSLIDTPDALNKLPTL